MAFTTLPSFAQTQLRFGLRERTGRAALAITPQGGGNQNDNAQSKPKKNEGGNKSNQAKRSYKSESEVAADVKRIIVNQLKVDAKKVIPEARIAEDLGADDLDQVELIMSFEEEFRIEVPDQDAQKLKRVGDINSYVWEHIKHR